jgi:hypothetical protein
MSNSAEAFGAAQLVMDASEIAAIVLQTITAASAREGRAMEPADLASGIEALHAAAWTLAKMTNSDPDVAKGIYVKFLRDAADNIEAI